VHFRHNRGKALILRDVMPHVTAVLGEFGVADKPPLELIKDDLAVSGQLPFEFPSSPLAVNQQKSGVSDDSTQPLFPRGFGMQF
jgi:beta-glucosidase